MNAENFINGFDYVDIKEKSENKEPFEIERKVKENGNSYKLKISGRFHTSWEKDSNDEVYHTFINFDYRGTDIGNGGYGGWFEFTDYEDLKNQIDKHLKQFPDYKASGQLCLF